MITCVNIAPLQSYYHVLTLLTKELFYPPAPRRVQPSAQPECAGSHEGVHREDKRPEPRHVHCVDYPCGHRPALPHQQQDDQPGCGEGAQ